MEVMMLFCANAVGALFPQMVEVGRWSSVGALKV
jgi:hypothetical protein